MAATTDAKPYSFADLLRRLGGVPPERIRMNPAPGTATEKDLRRAGKPICELIDGVLVEKAMGSSESMLGGYILTRISVFEESRDLGLVLGADGYIRIRKGLVRVPDVTFIPWSSLPDEELPREAFWQVQPGLIVEVLSPTNRKKEIDRKLREFFGIGCPLAWVIDPRTKTARAYTALDAFEDYTARGTLDASPVLPGFKLSLADVFGKLNRRKKS